MTIVDGGNAYSTYDNYSTSTDDISDFYVHTASVETFLGTTGYGVDTFAAPVNIICFVDDTRKLVRGADGQEIVSESTLYTFPTNAPLFTADSRVTVNGAAPRVIKTNLNDSGPLDLPDHVAVSLT